MYKGIIFDLDGTLLDTSEGVLASIRHTIKTMNYRELPLETLLTFIGPPVKRSLMNHYGLTDQEADEATEVFRQQYKNKDLLKAKPYDGILELLKALKDQGFLVGRGHAEAGGLRSHHFRAFRHCKAVRSHLRQRF